MCPFGYTVQYVPHGSTAQTPSWTTGALLDANQYVMASGIWNPAQRICDIFPLARKLYDGDSIVLTLTNLLAVATNSQYLSGLITYAIK